MRAHRLERLPAIPAQNAFCEAIGDWVRQFTFLGQHHRACKFPRVLCAFSASWARCSACASADCKRFNALSNSRTRETASRASNGFW